MDELRINKLNVTHDVLYGREAEMARIKDALSRVASEDEQNRSEMVLISGSSGTGKSALARKLKQPTERLGGYFVSGKFDQNRLLPYAAFREAIDELCEFLRNESDAREAVREAVSPDVAYVLVDLFPGVSTILGENQHRPQRDDSIENREESGGYLEAKQVLNYAIRTFLRTICQSRPVVILLDDLQWADEPSLNLLEKIVSDSEESVGLLFVICYRDMEGEATNEKLVKRLDSIIDQAKHMNINHIHVDNLSRDAVHELVAEMLRSDVSQTGDLADVVFDKTRGNAFFLIRFLQSLKEEGVLTYNLGTFKWNYSLEKANRKSVTDNVASLMASDMQRLPEESQLFLTRASFLGAHFSIKTLQKAMDSDHLDTDSDHLDAIIGDCVDLGLLQVLENDATYSFAHDQIQAAAKALTPAEDMLQQQLHIGLLLLEQSSPEDIERDLFVIVDLLNSGVQHATDATLRHRLTLLNLRAGKRSMSLSAFTSALSYLEVASELLGENGWHEQHHLCVDLFSLAAEAAYCAGDSDCLNHYVHKVLDHSKDFHETFRVRFVLITSLTLEVRYAEAIDSGISALKTLGFNFPKYPGKARVIFELMKTKKLVKRFTRQDLESLPVSTDGRRAKAERLMDIISAPAYFVRPNLLALLVFRMLQLAVLDGVSKFSAMGFTGYSMIVSSATCDFNEAHMFGHAARSTVRRLGAKDFRTRVDFMCGAFIDHWTQPTAQLVKPMLSTFLDGLAITGDIENALWSLQFAHGFMMESGQKLSSMHESLQKHEKVIKDYSQEIVAMEFYPMWQYVQNLMGLSEDPLVLTGEVMVEEELLQGKDPILGCFLYFLRSWLACYFSDYESAIVFVNRARPLESIMTSQHWCPRHVFFEGLSSFALCRQKMKTNRYRLQPLRFRRACESVRKLKKWVDHGNCNCVHLYLFLEAERLAVMGKEGVKQKFDAAIAAASKRGYIQDKALACERAGLFFVDRGEDEWASHYLSMCREFYSCWGAKAKVEQLDRTHPHLLQD